MILRTDKNISICCIRLRGQQKHCKCLCHIVLTILLLELFYSVNYDPVFRSYDIIILYFLCHANCDCSYKGCSCTVHKRFFPQPYINYYATGHMINISRRTSQTVIRAAIFNMTSLFLLIGSNDLLYLQKAHFSI